jgi:hypothetical protein
VAGDDYIWRAAPCDEGSKRRAALRLLLDHGARIKKSDMLRLFFVRYRTGTENRLGSKLVILVMSHDDDLCVKCDGIIPFDSMNIHTILCKM